MGRLTVKPFPDFPQLPIREVELSFHLDVAGKLVYLLCATVMLFIVLHKLKCCCRRNTRVGGHAHNTGRVNVVQGDTGGHTTSGQIATEVHHNVTGDDDEDDTMGSQISREVGIDVAVDDDDDINNGEIAMTQTSLPAFVAFLFN
ncbi:uncharacterized protein LOC142619627 [Castanea sativa]|uniref:uncharacterized protein LOC142619627 n=1 Tax=Castanea sativa TaxID=21020 RepID=UPI003F654007